MYGSSQSPSRLWQVAAVALLLSAAHPARAEWPPFGRAIASTPASQEHPAIASDGAGGAIVSWQDSRFPRINIFAQHVLATGAVDPAWPLDGRALLTDPAGMATAAGGQFTPSMVADGAGGAIVAWPDERSSVTGTDLFAQHILGTGAVDPAWPANGLAVSTAIGLQNTMVIAPDGAGGAFVAWVDSRGGGNVFDIYAQHLLVTGVADPRWPPDGLAVCAATGPQGFPALVPDGSGGVVVTWHDARPGSVGFDIYAQRVLASGAVAAGWPVDGRAVCTSTGDQSRPTVTADGAGGAIVAWTDARVLATSHIFAQHVLGSGTVDPAWPLDGRAISNAGDQEGRPLAVPDGAGGAIVNWQAFSVHLNMYAQHVKSTGVVDPAWPAGGRALSQRERQQTFADIIPDGAGGAVVAWQDSFDIVAQHVLASGALDPTYPDTGRAVCYLTSQQGDVSLVATGGGGAIATWTDGRSGTSTDIFAMQVLEAGTTGVPDAGVPAIAFARPSPNPARGSLTLRFSLPRDANVELAIYDLAGRRLQQLASGSQTAGEHAVAWDLRDDRGRPVESGVYFARLEVEGHSSSRRFACVR
jgi:hypothetical protein